VKGRRGRFTLQDCARLWASSEYANKHMELLALTERFELCYALRDAQPPAWLAPQLLSPSPPDGAALRAAPIDLVLQYRYSLLPRGLVSRLMVRLHRFIVRPELSWQNGALFEHEQSRLLVRVEGNGDISLRGSGPEVHGLLSVVASELDALN